MTDPLWSLDPEVTFLNHGSFGACPRPVMAYQGRLRDELEAQPVRFMTRRLEPLLDAARVSMADFVGADPAGVVFLNNATAGVNTALASFGLRPGDEVLVTDHGYAACNNAAAHIAAAAGASVRSVALPFPINDPSQATAAFVDAVTPATRIAIVDHVTSPSALVLPIAEIAAALKEEGVETLVDGAHGPGMLALNLTDLDVAYYTGNCHKWMCAPKGAAFLYTRADLRGQVRPMSIGHGATMGDGVRPRLFHEFDWQGTFDPTAWLSVPVAIETMGKQVEGGWPALRERNRKLALRGRQILCETLRLRPPCPDSMIGSMATLKLPTRSPAYDRTSIHTACPLHDRVIDEYGIEVPIATWPTAGDVIVRISAQLYNNEAQYQRLANVLSGLL